MFERGELLKKFFRLNATAVPPLLKRQIFEDDEPKDFFPNDLKRLT